LRICLRQPNDFGLLGSALGGLLDGRYHEVGQGATLDLRGTLEHGVQVGTDLSLKAGD
jgi:hypothetical protein